MQISLAWAQHQLKRVCCEADRLKHLLLPPMGIVLGIRGGRVKHRGSNPSFHQQDENPQFPPISGFVLPFVSLDSSHSRYHFARLGFVTAPAQQTWYKCSRKEERARDSHSLASRCQNRARGKCFHKISKKRFNQRQSLTETPRLGKSSNSRCLKTSRVLLLPGFSWIKLKEASAALSGPAALCFDEDIQMRI